MTLAAADRVRALDAEHVMTLALTASAEGDPIPKGNVTSSRLIKVRAATRDFIVAMGDAKGVQFGPRARLLLIRRDVGTEQESGMAVVRETGMEDVDVSDLIGFDRDEAVITGQINSATGLIRLSALYIGRFVVEIPDDIRFDTSGSTTEKINSVAINRVQTDLGLTSLSAKVAGKGFVTGDEGGEILIIVEGTVRIGAPKIVAGTTP
jgi:hypothetical protein